ncbi:MAG: hypothetical protein KIH63_005725 [Candidatus Saccharibacteria bacterium]|nr:hypothetical protein [Candidatus Saccharibacteria bacterium]
MGTSVLQRIKSVQPRRRLGNEGFIPLILTLLAVLIAVIVLVYLRVANAQK